MHLQYENVTDAFRHVTNMAAGDYSNIASQDNYDPLYFNVEETRNGKALVLNQMLAVTYENPRQYVLQNKTRNANPFFHFIEAVWMFAGLNTVSPLHYFCKQIEEYSDDPPDMKLYDDLEPIRMFNGAYGFRWRNNFYPVTDGTTPRTSNSCDQLLSIIKMLKEQPNTRRAVLQIWDPEWDLGKDSKDLPCNLCCAFQIHRGKLNMTVYNRSNDLVWGMFGSNVVHFSMLLEFIAISVGVSIGTYTQVSCNPHIYEQHWPKLEEYGKDATFQEYDWANVTHIPVMPSSCVYASDPQAFLIHCEKFIALLKKYIHVRDHTHQGPDTRYPFYKMWSPCGNPLFDILGTSLVDAWVAHKFKSYLLARSIIIHNLKDTPWFGPCIYWLDHANFRYLNRKEKLGTQESTYTSQPQP